MSAGVPAIRSSPTIVVVADTKTVAIARSLMRRIRRIPSVRAGRHPGSAGTSRSRQARAAGSRRSGARERAALRRSRAAAVTKPERRMGRLHRLVDDPDQLRPELVEVDLLAQTRAEPVDGLDRVVAGAVEAAIYELLDPRAKR